MTLYTLQKIWTFIYLFVYLDPCHRVVSSAFFLWLEVFKSIVFEILRNLAAVLKTPLKGHYTLSGMPNKDISRCTSPYTF